MKLRYRIQDWLADRVDWVQYPDIRRGAMDQRSKLMFANRMSFGQRIDLLLISLFILFVGTLALGAIGIVIYSFITG